MTSDTRSSSPSYTKEVEANYAVQGNVVSVLPATADERKMDRRILLKTDAVIITALGFIVMLEFLDKNALSFAAVYNLRKDTHLVGQQYSLLATIFYCGYLFMAPFSAWLLHRVPAGKLIGVSTVGWGVVLMTMAACHNFAGLATVRWFLGMFESSILPCCMLLSANFFRREEQALRACFWFNTFAGILGGVCSYGIAHIKSHIATWKLLFIIYGAVTIFVGVLAFVGLPDNPSQAWFLNKEEKVRAVKRLVDNQQGVKDKSFKWPHVFEALKTPHYWILMVFAIAQAMTNAGVSNFNPLIVGGLGFSPFRTSLLATPQAGVAVIAQTSLSVIALYYPNTRCALWIFSCVPALIGAVMVHTVNHVKHRAAALAGVYLMGFYNASWVLAVSLASSNVAGTTKKAFMASSMAVAYALGNILGPNAFLAREAPTYLSGIATMLSAFCIMAACGCAYLATSIITNRRRDAKYGPQVLTQEGVEVLEHEDLTDVENTNFRYSY